MDFLRYQRSMDDSTYPPMDLDYNYIHPDGDTSPGVHMVNVLPFLMDLIFPASIAIIGISFFIFILTKKELRNNPTCWLVMNVFMAILVHGFVVLPVRVYTMHVGGIWTTGLVGCFIFNFLNNVNQIHIQLSILLLMIDRFVYFLKQSNHPEIMTPKIVKVAILSSVACEIALSVICIAVNKPRIENYDSHAYCVSSFSSDAWIVHYSLSFLLPVGVNILFGLVTFVCTLVMCHKLNEGNSEERSKKKQAVALNIVIGLLNVTCCLLLPLFGEMPMITAMNFNGRYFWDIVINLNNMCYLVLPILIMVLIPEIRSEMACCKNAKKAEKTPLI